jgi:hypothetical protein
VPSGVWHPDEYIKLTRYDGDTSAQLEAGAFGAFYCHQQTGKLCAGWVGCHDMNESLALRFAARELTQEEIDACFDYVSPVPLFASGTEAAKHGLADVAEPGDRARRAIDRIERKRERQV